jgi:circadian clock protein KaiB
MPTDQAKQTGLVELRLYVSDQTRKSVGAFANLRRICSQHLPDQYRIEVIDILQRPEVAKREQIVATPTVVRRWPLPIRMVIGDLSNSEMPLDGLKRRTTHQGADL